MLKILLPTLFLSLALPFIPERYWMKIQELFRFLSLKEGEALIQRLAEIEVELQTQGRLGLYELPQYKFHTALLERVLAYARRFGSPVRGTLLELKEALGKDLQFERKIRKELYGGLAQFFLVALVTWAFVFLSGHILELKLPVFALSLMLFLQSLGFLSYLLAFRLIKKRLFFSFGRVFESFYSLLVLSEAGLSVRQSLQESELHTVLGLKEKRFAFLFSRMRSLVERWQNKGAALKQELKEVLVEAQQVQEEVFALFLKALGALKFTILCLAFLSAYFIYLSSLFRVFLIE